MALRLHVEAYFDVCNNASDVHSVENNNVRK